MDINQILKLGAEVFSQSDLSGEAGSQLDLEQLASGLSSLMEGGQGLDIAGLLGSFNEGGLADLVSSWLGDGANETLSPEQLTATLGPEKISEFARQMGLSENEAAGGLSAALPNMIDKASSDGSLLDSIGGIEGALNLAGRFFSR
mgnify:CR=1 FL=1